MKYRSEIDGLRAIAVVTVILFHAGFTSFTGGFVGVDVFFVISGFLITSIIISDKQSNQFSIVRFYERRARRILPALFLVLFACLFPAWLWLPFWDAVSFCKSLLAVSLFGSNFLFWSEAGYFDVAAELKPLLHTWSLAVEEQFYLVFPLLFALLWPLGRVVTAVVLLAVGLLSFWAAQVGVVSHPHAAFFLLPTRGWELLLGALLALYRSVSPARATEHVGRNYLYELASLIGLGLIGFSVFTYSKETPFPSVYTLVPTLGTSLLILFGDRRTFVGSLLSLKWIVGLGLISYSTYLWHYPMFAFARHASVIAPGRFTFSVLSLLAVVFAFLSWRFVERPFRDPERVSRRAIFAFSFLGIAFFATVGYLGMENKAFNSLRVTYRQQQVLDKLKRSPRWQECLYEERDVRPKNPCVYNEGKTTWAILGDSHSSELAMVLGDALKERGESLTQFSSKEKPSFNDSCNGSADCKTWTERSIDQIVADPTIRNVIVIYRMNFYLFGDHLQSYPVLPNERREETKVTAWRHYVEVLNRLARSGKRILLVLQVPELRKALDDIVFMNRLAPENIAGISREWWRLRSAYVTERLKEIPSSVKVFDPADVFCDDTECVAVKDGIPWYFDENHLSLQGASKLVPRILELGEPTGADER
jgi:peptidoglycan/LPS O-acetylase OafA/YrhL